MNSGVEDEDEDANEEIKELDDKWIHEFEKNDKLYEDFYLEDVYYTDIHYIYIDRHNNIEKMTEESFLMSNKNEISRDEIIQILKKSTTKDKKKYSLLAVLKCNITLKPEDVDIFIRSSNVDDYFSKFVTPIKTADNASITYEKTINMFQDLNDLLILLYERPPNSFSKTRKTSSSSDGSSHKKTMKQQPTRAIEI
jgi:hypothetical protein